MVTDYALELLRKGEDHYVGGPIDGPRDEYREGSRAVLQFFLINWHCSVPREELIDKALAVYQASSSYPVDREQVAKAVKVMLQRGDFKILRSVDKRIELNY